MLNSFKKIIVSFGNNLVRKTEKLHALRFAKKLHTLITNIQCLLYTSILQIILSLEIKTKVISLDVSLICIAELLTSQSF